MDLGEIECSGEETSIKKDGEDRTGKACVKRRKKVREGRNWGITITKTNGGYQ